MTEPARASGFFSRGGAWVIGQSVLMIAVIGLGVIFGGDWTRLPVIAAGAALFLIGGWFGVAGVMALDRNRTPFPKPRENSKLVQHGIYARIRHPLYSSVILASLGWAFLWQSSSAFIAALTLIPFFHAKARREECWLRQQFPDYVDYERRVPRFIPRLLHPPKPA